MRSLCGRIIAGTAIVLMAAATSCTTDFQVNAENQEEPIVYCILNSSSDTQYLKLNKTYLTDRAAFENPPDSDSLYFDGNIEVVLERWENNKVEDIFIFEPTTEVPKDSGFFPVDNNIIYKVKADIIPESKYSLSIYLENKEKIVYAETNSLGSLSVIDPLPIPERKVSLNIGQNYDCSWKPVKNAGIYQVVLKLHYMEYEGNDSIQKTLVWPQSFTSPQTNAEALSREISGTRFYYIVRDNISGKEGVIRKAIGMDFDILSGGMEIKYYIESTAPTEGALMEKPIYTNFTNGIGVFSTISSANITMLPIGAVTLDSLAYSQLTSHLGFLDHNGERND
jgi:hypothetical protein